MDATDKSESPPPKTNRLQLVPAYGPDGQLSRTYSFRLMPATEGMQALDSLVNGALSFAVSVTMVLTVVDGSDDASNRRDVALAAGISGFFSGFCASYFGGTVSRTRRNAL